MTAWPAVPLKYLVDINQRALPETTPPETEFRYIDISTCGRGRLEADPKPMRFADAPSRARRLVRPGDTVISTVRTYLRAVWPVAGPSDDLVVSTGFAVLSPRDRLDPRFLGWAAQSDLVIEEIVARSVGVSYPAINGLEVGELKVPVPDFDAQRAIADYLDRETSRIDALLRDVERLKHLAKKRVWARFCEMATSTAAPEVPLRRVLLCISDGPFGSAFAASDYSDDGAFVVRLGNIGMAEFHPEPEARIPMALYALFLRHEVRPGDLLIAGLGDEGRHAGRACVAPDLGPAMVKGKCFCARVDEGLADPRYLALYLSSSLAAQEVALVSHGSGRVMINLEIAKALPVILPVRSIQTEIVDQTAAEQERADRAEALLGRQVALLLERRQALITDAITGRFEIPGVAA